MVPRRNPELAIVVLQEHGDWGAGSAMIAQKIAIDVREQSSGCRTTTCWSRPSNTKPVEVGAVWSAPQPG